MYEINVKIGAFPSPGDKFELTNEWDIRYTTHVKDLLSFCIQMNPFYVN